MVRFDVSSLIQGRLGASLDLSIDAGPQSLSDLEVDSLVGTVHIVRVQGGLLVQGSIETRLELECVRCLEGFVFPVTLEIEETFRLSGAGSPYTVDSDGRLDLTPLVREQGWLAIPMKALCRPDCKGLCSQCGANHNVESCSCEHAKIDPRLALLKDLL